MEYTIAIAMKYRNTSNVLNEMYSHVVKNVWSSKSIEEAKNFLFGLWLHLCELPSKPRHYILSALWHRIDRWETDGACRYQNILAEEYWVYWFLQDAFKVNKSACSFQFYVDELWNVVLRERKHGVRVYIRPTEK